MKSNEWKYLNKNKQIKIQKKRSSLNFLDSKSIIIYFIKFTKNLLITNKMSKKINLKKEISPFELSLNRSTANSSNKSIKINLHRHSFVFLFNRIQKLTMKTIPMDNFMRYYSTRVFDDRRWYLSKGMMDNFDMIMCVCKPFWFISFEIPIGKWSIYHSFYPFSFMFIN